MTWASLIKESEAWVGVLSELTFPVLEFNSFQTDVPCTTLHVFVFTSNQANCILSPHLLKRNWRRTQIIRSLNSVAASGWAPFVLQNQAGVFDKGL